MANLDKIRAALKQLDPTNDDHWTEDGLAKTAVVQRIAGDTTIKRQDIQLASPKFERPALNPITGEAESTPDASAPVSDGGTVLNAAQDPFADLTQGDGPLMSEDEVKTELDRRVAAAQDAVVAAQTKIKEGQADLNRAQAAVVDAVKDRDRAFPPMTQIQAIKEHIASENAMREARMQHRGAPSQLDMAMRRGNSRGWRRPTRSPMGTQTGAVQPQQ